MINCSFYDLLSSLLLQRTKLLNDKSAFFLPYISHIGDTVCSQEFGRKHVVALKELIG